MKPERMHVQRSQGIHGEISVPGDKSISHRAVMLGSIASGMTEVRGLLRGEDTLGTLRAFQKLGVRIEDRGERLLIYGTGLKGLKEPKNVLDLGNSGTGLRLLSGLLAGQDFFTVLTGDRYLRGRPMGRIVRPLREMGAQIVGRDGGRLVPLAIQGGNLKGIDYHSPVSSAQVKSAILLAGLNARGRTSVSEPYPSRDHTERMFHLFGCELKREGTTVSLSGRSHLSGCSLAVPGDFSSAAFFIVAALIVEGSDLLIRKVGINPTRIGFLKILKRMGAAIRIESQEEGEEPVADIQVRTSSLDGTSVAPEEVPSTIDEFPALCVAAAFANGETRITGASELRVKETDRIHAMTVNLRAVGADVEERKDGLVIQGREMLSGGTCRSFGDHRVAMAMAVAGLRCERETTIEDTACIRTSFPGFRETLERVNRGRG